MTQRQKHPVLVGHRFQSVRKTNVDMTTRGRRYSPQVSGSIRDAMQYRPRRCTMPALFLFLPCVRSYSSFSFTRLNEAGLTAAVSDPAHLTASDCIRDEFACRLRTNTCYRLLVIPLTLNLLIKVITVPPYFLVYISLLLSTLRRVVVLPQSDRHKPA